MLTKNNELAQNARKTTTAISIAVAVAAAADVVRLPHPIEYIANNRWNTCKQFQRLE